MLFRSPYVTDWIHRELTGESVHLVQQYGPDRADAASADAKALDEAMSAIRALASAGRAARETAKVNVRQPLTRMVCVTGPLSAAAQALVPELVPILRAELNVKDVEFATSADALVSLEAKPNFRALGKVFGKETPKAAAAVQSLHSGTLLAFERGEPVLVNVDGREHQLTADDVTIVRKASGTLVVQQDGPLFAAIDPTVTPELRAEGIARELVSRTQRLRKERGLAVSDRIILHIAGPALVAGAAETHRQWIAGETLARMVHVADAPVDPSQAVAVELDGVTAHVSLTKDS